MWRAQHVRSCAHRSPEKPEMSHTQDCSLGGMDKNYSSVQKAGNWKWSTAWWSVLSVEPGHIKIPWPRPEVASNPNDLYIPTQLGAPNLSRPGPEMTNSPNERYTSCMTETKSDLSPWPISRTHLLGENDVYPELSFNAIIFFFFCVLGIVLHQEMCFQMILGLNTLSVNALAPDSRRSDPDWGGQSDPSFHSHLFEVHFPTRHDHLLGPSHRTGFLFFLPLCRNSFHLKPNVWLWPGAQI